jgi:hypothetical protein
MKRLAVVVPTYWGPVREYELGVPSPAYDHPTPLGAEGTLPRLLESLAQCRGAEFEVYLIVAPTEPGLGEAAEGRVQGIAAEFAGTMRVTVIGPSALAELKAELAEGLEAELLSLQGYGNVRNLGLAVGLLSGAEAIVFLDDDEVVEPGYLARAGAALAEVNRSGEAVGVAGPYLDQGGSPFLPEGPERGNIFLDKARYINQALRKLLQGEEKKPTPLAFGGNVVLSRSLAQKVPFDPLIPRGEDIDYVLSAWLLGCEFYFDPGLSVVHLPPAEPRPTPYEALRRDVVRFVYQRGKLAVASAQWLPLPLELGPYPGRFLEEDLEGQAASAFKLACGSLPARSEDFLARLRNWVPTGAAAFFRFVPRWRRLTGRLPARHLPAALRRRA